MKFILLVAVVTIVISGMTADEARKTTKLAIAQQKVRASIYIDEVIDPKIKEAANNGALELTYPDTRRGLYPTNGSTLVQVAEMLKSRGFCVLSSQMEDWNGLTYARLTIKWHKTELGLWSILKKLFDFK